MGTDTKNRLKDLKTDYERTRLTDDQIRKSIAGSTLGPMDLLLAVIRDFTLPVQVRMDAARSALPYTNQKKPIAIESTDKPFVITAEELKGMSKAELVAMKMLLAKIGVAVDAPTTH